MSFKIIKPGICDTFQDEGRRGFQHLGINPGGAMDKVAMHLANSIVGNETKAAILELHFPAATILAEQECLIAIAGADFAPEVDGIAIPLLQPVWLKAGSILKFTRKRKGNWCYLALYGGFALEAWLNSYSTHLKLGIGGWQGRALQKDDTVFFRSPEASPFAYSAASLKVLPWGATYWPDPAPGKEVWITAGPESSLLNERNKRILEQERFTILPASDRMAYSLSGPGLAIDSKEQLISSAVTLGTLQLLPDGQLLVLMADHQTTGGYPRVGQVIQAHLSKLAQCQPGDKINFRTVSLEQAQQLWLQQYRHLQVLKYAAKLRLESFKEKNDEQNTK